MGNRLIAEVPCLAEQAAMTIANAMPEKRITEVIFAPLTDRPPNCQIGGKHKCDDRGLSCQQIAS
jgi:hypothetical protein